MQCTKISFSGKCLRVFHTTQICEISLTVCDSDEPLVFQRPSKTISLIVFRDTDIVCVLYASVLMLNHVRHSLRCCWTVRLCGSRKYPYPRYGRSMEIPRRWGGGLKTQNFKRKVWGLTGNSRGGIQNKKLSMGGVWIFSGTSHSANQKL